jgi:hypothetical protein
VEFSFDEAVALISGPLGVDAEQTRIRLTAAWANGAIPWTADEGMIRHEMDRIREQALLYTRGHPDAPDVFRILADPAVEELRRGVVIRALTVRAARFTESNLLKWAEEEQAIARGIARPRRGTKAGVSARVEQAMESDLASEAPEALTRKQLAGMTGKELVRRYGGSEGTTRAARKCVLAKPSAAEPAQPPRKTRAKLPAKNESRAKLKKPL